MERQSSKEQQPTGSKPEKSKSERAEKSKKREKREKSEKRDKGEKGDRHSRHEQDHKADKHTKGERHRSGSREKTGTHDGEELKQPSPTANEEGLKIASAAAERSADVPPAKSPTGVAQKHSKAEPASDAVTHITEGSQAKPLEENSALSKQVEDFLKALSTPLQPETQEPPPPQQQELGADFLSLE